LSFLKTKSSLSPAQRRLVELMQQINFGRIEDLQVRAGEPVFSPAPRVVRKLKVGGDNGPRPEFAFDDFLLKNQIPELLETLAAVKDGEILLIDVRHGLPFAVEIEHFDAEDGARHA